MNFNLEYKKYQRLFESYLMDYSSALLGHTKLIKAMQYSLQADGKRVRPVLMLAATNMLSGDIQRALPFAFAIESIHTYSLIHDDLPAMDNDDLRRGNPTNHKVFGEDFAILAGDALLNLAFEVCLEKISCKREVAATAYLAECSGYRGMIGGQAEDILPKSNDEQQLYVTHLNKTAKLICAPLKMAAILFGKSAGINDKMQYLGELLGLIYQITDDILDVVGDKKTLGKSVNKDINQNKVSAIAVYGLEGAKKQVQILKTKTEKLLKSIKNCEFFQVFLQNSIDRVT